MDLGGGDWFKSEVFKKVGSGKLIYFGGISGWAIGVFVIFSRSCLLLRIERMQN